MVAGVLDGVPLMPKLVRVGRGARQGGRRAASRLRRLLEKGSFWVPVPFTVPVQMPIDFRSAHWRQSYLDCFGAFCHSTVHRFVGDASYFCHDFCSTIFADGLMDISFSVSAPLRTF